MFFPCVSPVIFCTRFCWICSLVLHIFTRLSLVLADFFFSLHYWFTLLSLLCNISFTVMLDPFSLKNKGINNSWSNRICFHEQFYHRKSHKMLITKYNIMLNTENVRSFFCRINLCILYTHTYWVTLKLPQICTVSLRICIGKVAWFAVYICGNFWVTQYAGVN